MEADRVGRGAATLLVAAFLALLIELVARAFR